jgi:hypothetical protein
VVVEWVLYATIKVLLNAAIEIVVSHFAFVFIVKKARPIFLVQPKHNPRIGIANIP